MRANSLAHRKKHAELKLCRFLGNRHVRIAVSFGGPSLPAFVVSTDCEYGTAGMFVDVSQVSLTSGTGQENSGHVSPSFQSPPAALHSPSLNVPTHVPASQHAPVGIVQSTGETHTPSSVAVNSKVPTDEPKPPTWM